MLPIFTTGQVKDGVDTGDLLIDLSDYIKKKDAATKAEVSELASVVANKLDAKPQHLHHISEVKELQETLQGKYDTSQKYSYSTILSDTEKIPYLEAPKIKVLEIADGYKIYSDETNGDLMISYDDILLANYVKATNAWNFGGVNITEGLNNVSNHTHTSFDNDLNINGNIDISGRINGYVFNTGGADANNDNTIPITVGQNTHVGHHITMHNRDNDHRIGLYCTDDELKIFVDPKSGNASDIKYATIWGQNATFPGNLTVNNTLSGTDMWLKNGMRFGATYEGGPRAAIGYAAYWSSGGAIPDPWMSLGKFNDGAKNLKIYDSGKVSVGGNLEVAGTVNVSGTNILAKITEMEKILKNHYDALLLLCEKHGMVDSNTNDGSNVSPQ